MAHSAGGSSGSFADHQQQQHQRQDDYPYNPGNRMGIYPENRPGMYQEQQDPREIPSSSRCFVVPAFVTVVGSLSVLFGFYATVHFDAGMNYSRVLQANSLFVRAIQVESYSGGCVLYDLRKEPQLNEFRDWSHTYDLHLKSGFHQEWAFWLNKGSSVNINYKIRSSHNTLIFSVIKSDRWSDWLANPNDASSTVYWKRIEGNGQLAFNVDKDSDDYYFALGNANNVAVDVQFELQMKLKVHNTHGYDSRCGIYPQPCTVYLPLFRPHYALLTTVQHPQEGVDIWRVNVSYKTRWATYFIIYGIIAVAAYYLFKKKNPSEDDIIKKSDNVPLINESSPSHHEHTSSCHHQQNQPQQKQEEDDNKLCVICLDARKECFFDPCGHCATCYPCGIRIRDESNGICPICRQNIQAVRRIFV